MTTENLYRPKGAGHRSPGDRRGYSVPKELTKAMEDWMKHIPEITLNSHGWAENLLCTNDWKSNERAEKLYRLALNTMPDVKGIGSEELNALVGCFYDHPRIREAGIFLSAAYNKSDLKEIMFEPEIEEPLSFVGYRLGKDKALIVLADTFRWTGKHSEGIIIGHGNCNNPFGEFCDEIDGGRWSITANAAQWAG